MDKLIPKNTRIIGFARSNLSDDDLRQRLRPFLQKSKHSDEQVESFLQMCSYLGGKSYGDVDAFAKVNESMEAFEKENSGVKQQNRLFYFAIPPNVFGETAVAIKKTSMQDEGKRRSSFQTSCERFGDTQERVQRERRRFDDSKGKVQGIALA